MKFKIKSLMTKPIKYLGINDKNVRLYTKNYKIQLKEIKKNPNKGKDIPNSQLDSIL